MKHFTEEQWADFARGAVGSGQMSLMENHLHSCRSCAKRAELWQRVAKAARRELGVEPPEGAVRYAKAMLVAERGAPPVDAAPTLGELIFDSLRVPFFQGVRSAATDSRQLLYRLKDHRIDLRMEPRAAGEKCKILGQILNSENPTRLLSNIPVSLHLGNKLLATSETNEFGEFALECEGQGDLYLSARLPDGRELQVLVTGPGDGPKESRNRTRQNV